MLGNRVSGEWTVKPPLPILFGIENRNNEWMGRRTCSTWGGLCLGIPQVSQPSGLQPLPKLLKLCDYCYRAKDKP